MNDVILRRVPMHFAKVMGLPSLPFGWAMAREWDTNSLIVGPFWAVVAWRLWQNRWALHREGAKRGWFILKEEGGYFRDGYWIWNEPRFV